MDKGKLLMIVNVAVSFIMVIAFIFMTLSMNSVVKALKTDGQAASNSDKVGIPKEQLEIVSLPDPMTINVLSDGEDAESHVLRISILIGLNTKAKDYAKISEQVQEKIGIIPGIVSKVVRKKNIEQIKEEDSQDVLAEEILSVLKKEFNTESIVNVYFKEYFYQ